MFAWSLADGRLFVDTVQDLVLRLDFVEPGEPLRLSPALPAVRHLLLDVRAYAHRGGEDGVRFCELAVRVVDDLEVVVRDHDAGDRSAWAGRRLHLLEISSELEQLVERYSDTSLGSLSSSASEARGRLSRTSLAGQERKMPSDAGPATVLLLDSDERRMLVVLMENEATSSDDGCRLKKVDVVSFGNLRDYSVRKAAKTLAEKALVSSFSDCRGGYWLTRQGIEVAAGLIAKPKK